jgi:hypothetical protein
MAKRKKRTNNDLPNITQNTEDLVIRTPLKTRGELFLYPQPRYTLIYIFDWSIYKLKHPIRYVVYYPMQIQVYQGFIVTSGHKDPEK